jgi:cysteine desulfurase
MPKKSIYLDYAATTPLDKKVSSLMRSAEKKYYANPASLHAAGIAAKTQIEASRAKIAQILNVSNQEIVFTSGGTESANLALQGVFFAAKNKGVKHPHFIITSIEHHCVKTCAEKLIERGAEVSFLPVNAEGFVDPSTLKKSIQSNTVLVSVIFANNEIGTIQDIEQIGKIIKKINYEKIERGEPEVYFHSDACQAAGIVDLNIHRLGFDLMTLSGSKIYGPKNSGLLFVKTGINIEPIILGGGQERGLRSGTESISAAVGLAAAFQLAEKVRPKQIKSYEKLWNYLNKEITRLGKGVVLNGPKTLWSDNRLIRLPNNYNFSVPNIEGETLMLYLDSLGIQVSTGSACSTSKDDPSHVLVALGKTPKQAKESLRISFGKTTTKNDLKEFLNVLKKVLKKID